MRYPEPKAGLVVCYAYLWRNEALAGREEGLKDRPCAIVIAAEQAEGQTLVTVAPITHREPDRADLANAIELPAATKARLGLDSRRSWVVASDLNQFAWPGVDLRPIRPGATQIAYGFLPASLTNALRAKILDLAKRGTKLTTQRTDV